LDPEKNLKATDESTTMAKTRKTPRPQKSSAKAALNKMKGAATTDTPPSDESDEAKVKDETVVGEHPEF
jgi:hypothetical protein